MIIPKDQPSVTEVERCNQLTPALVTTKLIDHLLSKNSKKLLIISDLNFWQPKHLLHTAQREARLHADRLSTTITPS
jgi:hypothetical protein